MPFNIICGDITTFKCDAIVNPTNQYLIAGGGIDKEIQTLAGNPLLIERIKIGTLSTGHAAITNAYNMPCKKIIHVSSPEWINGLHGEDILLASCYTEALRLAVENNINTIAFPLIASGINGFPDKKAFSIAKVTIQNFLYNEPDINVSLVIYDKGDIDFDKMLQVDVAKYVKKHLLRNQNTSNKNVGKHTKVPISSSPSDTNVEKSFTDTLFDFLNKKQLANVDCYKRANIDRKLFSKILGGNIPKKRTILALCIALKLNLDETEKLLNTAGYTLSHSIKADLIVEYFIVNNKFDIYELNEMLFDNGERMLGSI